MDTDRRLWIADGPAGKVRAFTLFGQQVVEIEDPKDSRGDTLGGLGQPSDVAAFGTDDELSLVVASKGRRRHALQIMQAHRGRVHSLRPLGDPRGTYRDLAGVALDGEWLYALERGASRVQVFRNGDFHFCIPVLSARGEAVEPSALAVLSERRLLVTTAGESSALLLMDRTGRILRVLAERGSGEGQVSQPGAVAAHNAGEDGDCRVFVLDRDGGRIQLFTLRGRCFGSFTNLSGSSA